MKILRISWKLGIEFRDVPAAESAARAGIDEALAIDRHAHRGSRVPRRWDRADPFATGVEDVDVFRPPEARHIDEAVMGGGIVDRDRRRTAEFFVVGVRIGSSGQCISADVGPLALKGTGLPLRSNPSDFRPLRERAGAEHIDELGRFDVRHSRRPHSRIRADGERMVERMGRDRRGRPADQREAESEQHRGHTEQGSGTSHSLSPPAVSHCHGSLFGDASVLLAVVVVLLLPHALPVPLDEASLALHGRRWPGAGTAGATVWNVWSGPAVVRIHCSRRRGSGRSSPVLRPPIAWLTACSTLSAPIGGLCGVIAP